MNVPAASGAVRFTTRAATGTVRNVPERGDATRPWRDKPSLVDNGTLGQTFRDRFVRGLGWLIRNDRLKLTDEWQQLTNPKIRRQWLKSLKASGWNVFIQGPPRGDKAIRSRCSSI